MIYGIKQHFTGGDLFIPPGPQARKNIPGPIGLKKDRVRGGPPLLAHLWSLACNNTEKNAQQSHSSFCSQYFEFETALKQSFQRKLCRFQIIQHKN